MRLHTVRNFAWSQQQKGSHITQFIKDISLSVYKRGNRKHSSGHMRTAAGPLDPAPVVIRRAPLNIVDNYCNIGQQIRTTELTL